MGRGVDPAARPTRGAVRTAEQVTARPALDRALAVLRRWDVRRAAAWAEDDGRGLRALYAEPAPARTDLRLLRAYRARGLVVRRLHVQVFAVRVLRTRPTRLRLWVHDRVAGGEVVSAGRTRPLRSSAPDTRVVDFRFQAGAWRLAGSRPAGPQPVSDWGADPRAGLP